MNHVRIKEAAEALGISVDVLRRAANNGKLPDGMVILTPGGHRRFDLDRLTVWAKDRARRRTKI